MSENDPRQLADHRDAIALRAREEGAVAVIEYIRGFADVEERLGLHALAERTLGGEMPDADLDDLVDVVEAGIAEALEAAEAARDGDVRAARLALASDLASGLAGRLVDDVPEDERPREMRHHEAGLEAAHLAVQWREELGTGPALLALAWRAKGMHLLALEQVEEAETAFRCAVALAEQAARASDEPVVRDARGHWGVLQAWGHLALAHARRTGDVGPLEAALLALDDAAVARPGEAEVLRAVARQLRCARVRHGGTAAPTG